MNMAGVKPTSPSDGDKGCRGENWDTATALLTSSALPPQQGARKVQQCVFVCINPSVHLH